MVMKTWNLTDMNFCLVRPEIRAVGTAEDTDHVCIFLGHLGVL